MNVAQAMAAILKQEGIDLLFCYPTSQIIDEAALVGIRPIVVRQERTGLHMADAYSRLTSGQKVGVFAMQHGPGTENAYGGIAQAYADSVPLLVLPQGYPQRLAGVKPNYNAAVSMRDITKSAEALGIPTEITNIMRRAFSQIRNGRGGPVLVEVPADMWSVEIGTPEEYTPVQKNLYAPNPEDVAKAVDLILSARAPVIHAGQGIHFSQAWGELKEFAELLGIPVVTTLPGKSAFPEDHPLSVGSGGLTYPMPVKQFLDEADVIIGLGCSFTETLFAVPVPRKPKIIHLTLDPAHLHKDVKADVGMVGDARLALAAMLEEVRRRAVKPADYAATARKIADARDTWLAEWMPKLTSNSEPLSPYRVIWDLQKAVKDEQTIITNDAGRPRDQLTPFWVAKEPQSFVGWGKTTQLGYSLGIAMGAKLACPDKLCINVWGDAAIGFTGTDLETAARAKIPVLSILLNNKGMATELKNIPNAIRLYSAADISGNYTEFAQSLGLYAERVTAPEDIIPAVKRAVQKTKEGIPALLEFMTTQETSMSKA